MTGNTPARRTWLELACWFALLSLLSFLATTRALGAEPTPTPALVIQGPDTLDPADYAQFTVQGLAAADLGKARVVVWPRDKVIAISAATWAGEPFILFAAKPPGTYLLAIAVAYPTGLAYAEKVVAVGGGPVPPPPPPPPPPVPGVRHLIFVEETQQRTAPLAAIVTSQKLRDYLASKKSSLWDFDKDAQTGTAASWVARAAGKVPKMFIADDAGKVVWSGTPPVTVDEVIALLKEGGG